MGELEIIQQPLPDPNDLYNKGKQEISDLRELKVGSGSSIFYTDKEGSRWGNIKFDDAPAWIKVDGSAQFKTSNGDILLSTSAVDGNFINIINTALNTSSKTILADFTFEATDYAGAFKAGNPTWDEVTGLITGGSGVLINARGILGANNGNATFTLDATNGNATFAGTLAAPNGTLGTITAGTITGATIQTAASGYRARMASGNKLEFLLNNTSKGSIYADTGDSMVYSSADNHIFFNATTYVLQVNSDGLNIPATSFLSFVGGARIGYSGGGIKMEGATGGATTLIVEGTVRPESDNSRDLGTPTARWQKGYFEDIQVDDIFINSGATFNGNGGQTKSTHKYITDCYWEGTSLKVKERYLAFTIGGVTSVSGESTRTVHTF